MYLRRKREESSVQLGPQTCVVHFLLVTIVHIFHQHLYGIHVVHSTIIGVQIRDVPLYLCMASFYVSMFLCCVHVCVEQSVLLQLGWSPQRISEQVKQAAVNENENIYGTIYAGLGDG